jgi:AcrR family transcriptional regulator
VQGASISRSSIRSEALALIAERGLTAVSIDDIAARVGITPAGVLAEFPTVQQVVSANDFFAMKVESFIACDQELTCSGAWLVALDERAASVTAEQWSVETERQRIFGVESAALDNVLAGIGQGMAALTEAVVARTGAAPHALGVRTFVGTVIGLQLAMPSGAYPDAKSWTNDHAAVIDAIGPGLDRLLSS